MDSLPLLKARLEQIIDAKLIRRQACLDEAAAIDRELAEARALLDRWEVREPVPPAPVAIVTLAEPVATPSKPPREIRMHREDALAFIRSKRGPVHWREILDHFGIEDGRASVILRTWVKEGRLVNCGDGLFTVSEPEPVEIPA